MMTDGMPSLLTLFSLVICWSERMCRVYGADGLGLIVLRGLKNTIIGGVCTQKKGQLGSPEPRTTRKPNRKRTFCRMDKIHPME